ncbi:MAG TPA: hypothetical protein VFX98_15055, partial [Longimicrobiaceae bacterium]|nr:hypothetical protein [Longimicrobiaceae bacterium]
MEASATMEQAAPPEPPVSADVAGGGPRDLLASLLAPEPSPALRGRLARLTAAEWETLAGRALGQGSAP